MTMSLSTALRNSRLDLITSAIDAGSAGGTLKFYTGPRPATGATITTQTLLATLTFNKPSAPSASNGVLNLNPITQDSSADASGTAAWARIQDSNGNFVADLDVGAAGSGSDIELVDTNIVAGQVVAIAVASITEGNG